MTCDGSCTDALGNTAVCHECPPRGCIHGFQPWVESVHGPLPDPPPG